MLSMNIDADITAKAESLRLALRAKLGVRGRDFAQAADRAGRLLPARLRKQAAVIVKAQGLGGHPKLMRMVDVTAITKAHVEISTYLSAIDPKERRRTKVLRWVGGIVFNLILVAVCFVIWLIWSGNL
jgi:hypothetical protein